ncbi:hypothetical protein C8R45DRAFT_995535 [Mycena sanguinolenta]|nr:hypothetical protein C8R45DRAFT_995535 [Mycena sanguinolenta]
MSYNRESQLVGFELGIPTTVLFLLAAQVHTVFSPSLLSCNRYPPVTVFYHWWLMAGEAGIMYARENSSERAMFSWPKNFSRRRRLIWPSDRSSSAVDDEGVVGLDYERASRGRRRSACRCINGRSRGIERIDRGSDAARRVGK